jgi:hypothetical protein
MAINNEAVMTAPTLPFSGVKAFIFEGALVATAIALPVAAHLFNAPVRYLLPMHWAIILAGLIYGWRAGALAGLVVPAISYLLSGMPFPNVLPSMTAELLTYGFVAGVLRERIGLNAFASVAIALVVGRIGFVIFALFTNSEVRNLASYFQAALVPGLGAAVCQVILLPFVARWWVNSERKGKE